MKKLLLISGDLAAGKTTVGRAISKELKIPYFCKDEFKELISDFVGFNSREENHNISRASVNSLIIIFKELIISEQDVILEANFRSTDLDQIFEIARNSNYKIYPIFMTGDKKILFDRYKKREPHRHPTHHSAGLEKDYSKFSTLIDEYRDFSKNYNFIFINSTDLDSEAVIRKVLKIFND